MIAVPSLFSLPQGVEKGERFIKPNWAVVADWLDGNVPAEQLNVEITQVMEDMVVEGSYFSTDHELDRRHRAYWNSETIDTFWSGDSFFLLDDGRELTYHLSQILARNLMVDFPKQISPILNSAHCTDAGEAALLQLCGMSLDDRVKQFLGDGEWKPRQIYSEIDRLHP